MRNGRVTPVSALRVHPVVYIDLDMSKPTNDESADEITHEEVCRVTAYPMLRVALLTAHGPAGGNPVYRIEGPLDKLVQWMEHAYGASSPEGELFSFYADQIYLAQ